MTSFLPDLPQGWRRSRLDRIASVNARIGWKALTADEYVPDGVAFLSTPNIKGSDIDFENVNFITEFRYLESPELQLRVGDVLLVKDGNTLGITNLVKHVPRAATVNGSIALLRAYGIEPSFLRYVLASDFIQGMIGAYRAGMGVPHLFQADIKKFPLLYPPSSVQRAISGYLDTETARIDKLIEKKRRMVQVLGLRQASVRENLVVGGDDCSWTVLGRFVRSITQGESPQCSNNPAEGTEWGLLKLSAVKKGRFVPRENKALPAEFPIDKQLVPAVGDLLVTRSNTPSYVGDACAVIADPGRVVLCDLIYRLQLNEELLPEFAAQVLLTRRSRFHLSSTARGSSQSMVKLRGEDIKATPVPVLPISDQRNIVSTITDHEGTVIKVQDRLKEQIDLLLERRQALITAAVTGELPIQGVAA